METIEPPASWEALRRRLGQRGPVATANLAASALPADQYWSKGDEWELGGLLLYRQQDASVLSLHQGMVILSKGEVGQMTIELLSTPLSLCSTDALIIQEGGYRKLEGQEAACFYQYHTKEDVNTQMLSDAFLFITFLIQTIGHRKSASRSYAKVEPAKTRPKRSQHTSKNKHQKSHGDGNHQHGNKLFLQKKSKNLLFPGLLSGFRRTWSLKLIACRRVEGWKPSSCC